MIDRKKDIKKIDEEKVMKSKNSESENKTKAEFEPEVFQEIIEQLPPDEKSMLEAFMIQSSMTSTSSPFPPQLLNKLNEKHIDRILDISDDSDKRDYDYKIKKERYTLYYAILGVGVFVFLTVFLAKDQTNLFLDVVKIGAGFLGGLGLGVYKKNKT